MFFRVSPPTSLPKVIYIKWKVRKNEAIKSKKKSFTNNANLMDKRMH